MDAVGECGAKVGDARVGDDGGWGSAVGHVFGHGCCARCWPEGDFFDAVFDAEGASGAGYFDAPPAAEAKGGVTALAEEVAHCATGKAYVDAVEGEHEVSGLFAEAGAVEEGLYLSNVAAEVAHDAEGVGEEGFDVEVGVAPGFGAFAGFVGFFAASKAHFVNAVNLFAYFVFGDVFSCFVGGLGEVVIEVAAEVDVLLGGEGDHVAGFVYVVGEGFFAKDVFACGEGFHGGFVVPASVFVAAGGDVDDVEVFVFEHVFEGVVGFDVVFFGGFVGGCFDDVAYGYEV